MNVCVMGLWHLGNVTAACLASKKHSVVGLDFNSEVIEQLRMGNAPLYEPGLEELIKSGIQERFLSFTTDPSLALKNAELVWITYDTPVDDNDHADIDFVITAVKQIFPYLKEGTLVLISSQLPVGTTFHLEQEYLAKHSNKNIHFACSPENLRLGKAIQVFNNPDRIVVGIRSESDKNIIQNLLTPFNSPVEWMSVESAEMSKHAINAFLAISVAFANEIATICEEAGADAKEVERGLKSESRIGPKAYLSPGVAFAGGTLARDIDFLIEAGSKYQQPVALLKAVKVSNNFHKNWIKDKLKSLAGNLKGKTISVLGLTYKPGTDTLRRSSAIELCIWLVEQGAKVKAYDPAVRVLPPDLANKFELLDTLEKAINNAVALIIMTEWPEFKALDPNVIVRNMLIPQVIDPTRFIKAFSGNPEINYITVGNSSHRGK